MARFRIDDIYSLEKAPTSPSVLRSKLGQVIESSTVCRTKINAVNNETGEYQIVLQGTLDKEESKWDWR